MSEDEPQNDQERHSLALIDLLSREAPYTHLENFTAAVEYIHGVSDAGTRRTLSRELYVDTGLKVIPGELLIDALEEGSRGSESTMPEYTQAELETYRNNLGGILDRDDQKPTERLSNAITYVRYFDDPAIRRELSLTLRAHSIMCSTPTELGEEAIRRTVEKNAG